MNQYSEKIDRLRIQADKRNKTKRRNRFLKSFGGCIECATVEPRKRSCGHG